MAAVLVALGVLSIVAGIAVGVAVLPLVQAVRERQQVEQEVRLSEWQMRHIAQAAMQRLLDEARRSSS